MARTVKTIVTYLQMASRPGPQGIPHPGEKVAILRAEQPPLHFYRYLYTEIGRHYTWVIRAQMSDAELTEIIAHPDNELYVLYLRGVPCGMAELDFRERPVGQLAYFGLMEHALGRGLGKYFLHQAAEIAWARPIERLLVNTCTLDHPRALPLYQRMGFEAYAQSEQELVLND